MQKTFLEKNPFYILEVMPGDKRATIISKAEEKAFFADGNECEEAQAILINPTRRLSVELEWFFDVSAKTQAEIVKNIKSKKEICTDELSGISRLNAALHNFSVLDFDDYFEIGYAILEIDELYEELDASDICDVINKYRAQAGIAPATEDDIISALGRKRATIRQTLRERVEALSEVDYVELVSMIAEKCIAEDTYNDGMVISDIVDQYEVRMKSVIDEKMDAALSLIEKVDSNTNKPVMDLTVKNLIIALKEFDKYAQPLQIKSSMDGFDHEQSLHLARECREFAIELHNEYENSDASFKLIHTLRDIFPELTEFSEIITNDEKQITKIKKEKEQFKKDLEANKQANKRYTVNIRGERFVIPPFCTCCMKPTSNKENVSYSMTTQRGNTKTTRSIAVDLPICDECLKHRSQYNWILVLVCSISIVVGSIFMAILMAAEVDGFLSFLLSAGVSIGAYYGISAIWKTKPLDREHARRGKSAHIFSMFLDGYLAKSMPNSSGVTFTFYNWEYAHLFQEANKEIASEVKEATELNTARTTSVLNANEHPVANMFKMIGVFVAIALIIGMIFESSNSGSNYNSNSNTNNNYNYNNNYDYDDDYDYTPSPNYGSGNSVKANQLKSEIENLRDEIDDMERDLEKLSDDIDYYERQYYNTGYDFYANYYDDAVDDYNDLYDEYTEAIDDYNDKVNEYNRLIGAD